MGRARTTTALALAGLVVALTSGCVPSAGPVSPPADLPVPPPGPGDPPVIVTPMPEMVLKHVDSEERTDLEALTARIPALAGGTAATWYTGRLEDQRTSGPDADWIDAVVTLPPGAGDELRETLTLAPASDQPRVVKALSSRVPSQLLTGPELDEAFSDGPWRAHAYLDATGDDVVLAAVAE